MNYSKNSMLCYLIKCGVSDVHAMTLTNLYGDMYTSLHTSYRSQGYGNQSKAMAILFMTDFHTLHDLEGPLLLSGVYDEDAVFNNLMNTISAFTCHALVSAYALGEDRSKQVSDNFSHFIKMLIDTINKRGIEVHTFSEESLLELVESFSKDIERKTIGSLALGSRKGFFARLFG